MYPNFSLVVLINTHNQVLLLRRINTPFCNNCYSLPGGIIAPGESATQAVIRELHKSLGITMSPHDVTCVHVMHRKCNEPEFFACVFKAYVGTRRAINNDPERYDDMQWFSFDNVPEKSVPAHVHAIKQIQENKSYSEHGW